MSPLVRRIAKAPTVRPGLNTLPDPGSARSSSSILDQGPSHLDVLCGCCGGDGIRWIITDDEPRIRRWCPARLKELTGAELVAPKEFVGADTVLDEDYQVDATEFRISTLNIGDPGHHVFILEQGVLCFRMITLTLAFERAGGTWLYRLKSVAPGHGQYIGNAKKSSPRRCSSRRFGRHDAPAPSDP
ncbi:MAG: hypothetical protein R2706_04675 [Acidimicrobiales bacterium]